MQAMDVLLILSKKYYSFFGTMDHLSGYKNQRNLMPSHMKDQCALRCPDEC
jgi:hypothetical protein